MLVFAIIIGSLFLFVRFWMNDAFKQYQISDIDWQLGSLGLNHSKINALEFKVQNRFKIKLTNLELGWLFTTNPNNSSNYANSTKIAKLQNRYINSINIESALIQNLYSIDTQPDSANTQTLNQSITSAIKFIKLSSQGITPSEGSERGNRTLMEALPFLPNTININHLEYSQPCKFPSEQNCRVRGQLRWQNQITPQQLVSHLNFDLQDKKHPKLNLHSSTQLLAVLKSQQLTRTQLDTSISLFNKQNNQELLSIDWKNQTTIQTKNHLKTQFNIQSLPGLVNQNQNSKEDTIHLWQTLNKMSHRWVGQSLQVIPKVSPQANINLNADIDLNPIHSSNLKKTKQDLLNTFVQNSKLDLKLSANSQEPITIKNQVNINGKLNAVFNAKNGVVKQYELHGNGNLHIIKNADINKQLQQYSVNLTEIDYQIESVSKVAVPLRKDLITQFPFKLNLQTPYKKITKSTKNTKNRTKTSKSSLNKSEHSRFNLNLLGNFSLSKQPTVEVILGKLSLFSPKLQLNPSSQFKQTQAQLEFKGVANLVNDIQTWKFQSNKGEIQTQIQYNSNGNDSSINNAKLVWKNLDLQQDNVKSLATIDGAIQSIEFTGNIQHPLAQAEAFQLRLKKLSLSPVLKELGDKKSIALNKHHLKAQYQFSTHQFTQAHLLPQSWKGRGNLNADLILSNKIINLGNQIQLQGNISNQAGLVVFHNAFYTPTQIYSDWFIPSIYFLAGNSPQKTFADWPKLVSIGSGILQGEGSASYKLAKNDKDSNWIDNLEVKGNLDTKGLSGILNETTINQLTTKLQVELTKNQFIAKIPQLSIEQLNHGLIIGPITFKGDYTASVSEPIKGVLQIDNATSQLFKGQAWLDSQTIHLADPFTSKLHLKNIDIQALLKQYPSADIKGTGAISGDLPFSVNLLKKPYITVQKGILQAKTPGGLIQYKPASSSLKQTHQSMQLVMSVLEDFHYSLLESQVTYNDNNQLVLKLSLQGKNPAVESGRQVNFNIQLEEDLPALITSMQISNQVSETIKKRIQSKLQNTQP